MGQKVKPERTGWRDLGLSKRHRLWGVALAATDLDFILCEASFTKPIALVEYKNEKAPAQHFNDHGIQRIKNLADMAKIPAFACRYATDYSWYRPVALNERAKVYLPDRCEMSEPDFVRFLYRLRGMQMPPEVFDNLGPRF